MYNQVRLYAKIKVVHDTVMSRPRSSPRRNTEYGNVTAASRTAGTARSPSPYSIGIRICVSYGGGPDPTAFDRFSRAPRRIVQSIRIQLCRTAVHHAAC